MAEILRVLKPGGQFVFLEHGLNSDPSVQRWQRRITPLQRLVGDGCRLDRDMRSIISTQPFRQVDVENFDLEQTPPMFGFMYRGSATK
jgi:hypothetical protein